MTPGVNSHHISFFAILSAIFIAIAFSACDSTPDGIIPRDEMVSLMADIHLGESVAETERRAFPSDSMKKILKQSILAAHGYTLADFDTSLVYYGHNIDKYAKLYDDVIANLEERIALTEAAVATEGSSASSASQGFDMSFEGDSVDVWNQTRTIFFSSAAPVASFPWGLSSDRYWEKGDVYTIRGKLTGASDGLAISLAVEYMDGTVDHMFTRGLGNGWKEAKLVTDSARTPRYVYGIISAPSPERALRAPAVLDSITLFRTRFSPLNRRDPRIQTIHPQRRP